MLLMMELFLLVRHTHSPLRIEMADIHTKAHLSTAANTYTRVYTITRTLMEIYISSTNMRHQTPRCPDDGSMEITES